MLTSEGKKILPQASTILKTTKINFDQELKRFLPKTHFAIIRDFKASLEKELEKFGS